jgi:hypothetical protein
MPEEVLGSAKIGDAPASHSSSSPIPPLSRPMQGTPAPAAACTGQRREQRCELAVVAVVRVAESLLHTSRGAFGQGAYQSRAVHADTAVDAPRRNRHSFGVERALPCVDVKVIGIDKSSIDVKQDGGPAGCQWMLPVPVISGGADM